MTEQRHVAAGGWRRALLAFSMGAAVGFLIALVRPRDGVGTDPAQVPDE